MVVTDSDPSAPGNRKEDLEALTAAWGVSNRLKVFTNAVTLEHELFVAGNEELLKRAFLGFHPQSANRWATDIEGAAPAERADGFVKLLVGTRTRKGDFAQQLSAQIDAGAAFNVPQYLREAILAASAQ